MCSARVLFGAASPLIVDYEETLDRLSLELRAVVSVGGPIRTLNRRAVVGLEACTAQHHEAPCVPCAFTPIRRRALSLQATDAGFQIADALIDPTAVVARTTRASHGTYINALAVIGGASRLGSCVVVNRAANIGHHCILSDFCSVGPGASLAGNVRVGEMAVIGIGAIVFPDVRIGEGAVVSGGAVVRKDVSQNAFVAGNPARVVKLNLSQSVVRTTTEE